MTQFGIQTRRGGGELDVYTALLAVAALVLVAGIAIMAMTNMEHSAGPDGSGDGGVLTVVK